MRKIYKSLIVAIILVIAGFIYIYKLDKIPSGVYVDEATVAYNAFSISETGRDEYGKSYPMLFRLLGSYTPPVFVYSALPLIKLFGTKIIAFRFISVVSALVSILIFYQLIRKMKLFRLEISYYAATLFYAISPWLVFNARLGYEVTLAYTIFNIGLYFYYASIKNSKFLVWGVMFSSLSTYIAHTQRYLFFAFIPLYFLFFRRLIFKKSNVKILKRAVFTLFITQIPNLLLIGMPAFWVKNERLLDQKPMELVRNLINQFLTYVSPKSLFFEMPDIDLQHTLPEISLMYNWMVIPYLFGIFLLIKNLKAVKYKFILFVFVLSILPATMSGQFVSTQRLLPFLFPLMVVIGIGIDILISKTRLKVSTIAVFLLTFYSLIMLYRSYFVLFPIERANAWNYGYEDLVIFLNNNPEKKYIIDNTRNPRLYILLLYFLRYPPDIYQKEVDKFYLVNYYKSPPPVFQNSFGNIEVRPIDWSKDPLEKAILIGDPLAISEGQQKEHSLSKIHAIKDVFGDNLFVIYRTRDW